CILTAKIIRPLRVILSAGFIYPCKRKTECTNAGTCAINSGCKRIWDQVLCWPDANPGQTLTFTCPGIFFHFTQQPGLVKRNCTAQGWTDPFPPYSIACPVDDDATLGEMAFLSTIKTFYTVGYSISTTSLVVAVMVLVAFRRLHCPRNYIHIHLFLTFILKAVAIFIKDVVLFQTEDPDSCGFSTTECKISMLLCHYFTMSNFMWLLVEALYINALLLSSFAHGRRYFWWLVLFGWGNSCVLSTVETGSCPRPSSCRAEVTPCQVMAHVAGPEPLCSASST
uniref:Growth hormone releasing hormone receptor n=1 Tax=Varanus komodoensis TaxID=61221 RepID=A0A8D2LH25_VARKO